MHLSVAVAKINKWAVRESGDTLEMIERPHGGLSFVLADGQSSGLAAKALSIRVVRKVISDLAEGVRDGAAARAANDMLHAHHQGKVSASLVILSVELNSSYLVITRCGALPVFLRTPGGDVETLYSDAPALGFYRNARPLVDHVYLEPGLLTVAVTDGVLHSGSRTGRTWDVGATLEALWEEEPSAQAVANGLLEHSVAADDGRPVDDTSIVVLHLQSGEPTGARYLRVEVPLPDSR